MHAASYEWLKILIAALTGLFAGLVAEPIKLSLQWRINTLRMYRAIGLELLMLRWMFVIAEHDLAPVENAWQAAALSAYEYHWQKSREYFYDNTYLYLLHRRCELIQQVIAEVKAKRMTYEDGRQRIYAVLDQHHKESPKFGKLDRRLQRMMGQVFK